VSTDRAIRRGVFPSVDHDIAAKDDYLDEHDADPKPFSWTAGASSPKNSPVDICRYIPA
jgi:hypothetical protein